MTSKNNIIVGVLTKRVIELLDLNYNEGTAIILGDSNIQHMKAKHLLDYNKYGKDIKRIIKNPTYVARNPKQGSIEYIKEYKVNNEFVLVAVRVTYTGKMFARTLFTMTQRKKNIYLKNGYAKKY